MANATSFYNTTCSSIGNSYSCSTMDNQEKTNTYEYEAQHFGFTPNTFCNGVYNASLAYIQAALQKMETYITAEYSHVIKPDQVREACDGILTNMVSKLDKNFDIIETYLVKHVLVIPDSVVLPEDKHHMNNTYTKEQEEALDTDIQELKDRILALRYANRRLKGEIKQIDQVQALFDEAQKQLQRLDGINSTSGDLKDCLVFTSQKAHDLVTRVKAMRTKNGVTAMETETSD